MKCTGIHHVGLWVDDVEEMIVFLTEIMGFQLQSRNARGSVGSGERIFVRTGDNQLIELLAEPQPQPRPDFPLHPLGHVVGVPHLCFAVTELPAWREKLQSHKYNTSQLIPENGYMESELGPVRLLWFEGPSGVACELFELEQ